MTLSTDIFSPTLLSFVVIFLAEIGDKSQLVCMTLAAKHKAKPVAIGAILAFMLLNFLAVTVGVSFSLMVPEVWLKAAAACIFIIFGVHTFVSKEQECEEGQSSGNKSARSLLFTTFILIFMAELGDKTQLAVVTMSTSYSPTFVWLGATLALAATSLIGVYAGRRFLSRWDSGLLHKLSGFFFLAVGGLLILELI